MRTIIELNRQLTTARQFITEFQRQEQDLLSQLAEATADAKEAELVTLAPPGVILASYHSLKKVVQKYTYSITDFLKLFYIHHLYIHHLYKGATL